MARRTQKQIVLDLMIERGERGMSAYEAIYDLHITRLAAIIFDLRQDGYQIRMEQPKGETARYYLMKPSGRTERQNRECGTHGCGHLYRRHISGMHCMDYDRFDNPCHCERFTEQKEPVA